MSSYEDRLSFYQKAYGEEDCETEDYRDSDEYYDRVYEDYRAMQMMRDYEEDYK